MAHLEDSALMGVGLSSGHARSLQSSSFASREAYKFERLIFQCPVLTHLGQRS